MSTVGEKNYQQHPILILMVIAVCWLIWTAGIVLGILALRWRKIAGRKGVSGRAIVGIILNFLLLGVTIAGTAMTGHLLSEINKSDADAAEREFERLKAKLGDGEELQKELALQAARGFAYRMREPQKNYQFYGAALTGPSVLDMSLVKRRKDLQDREEVIRDFITATEELLDFCASAPDIYRQELLKHKLTPEARDAAQKEFTESLRDINPTIVACREADVRRGKAMLKVITFLNANWGKWVYKLDKDRLEFDGVKLSQDYKTTLKKFDDETAVTFALEAKVKQLQKPKN